MVLLCFTLVFFSFILVMVYDYRVRVLSSLIVPNKLKCHIHFDKCKTRKLQNVSVHTVGRVGPIKGI